MSDEHPYRPRPTAPPPKPLPGRRPLPPLSPAEQARVADIREQARALPGVEETIRELYEAGLIDGWRNVLEITPLEVPDGID